MGIELSVIWFVIIVFATLMYIVMDGFDLGIGLLFSTVRGGGDRDVMVNSVAPVWDGNETWLVLGGAGLFGAFPLAYAVIIDALSIPLTLMLIGLIFAASPLSFASRPRHRTGHSGIAPFWRLPAGNVQPGRGGRGGDQRFHRQRSRLQRRHV